jgi:hypothetical protein
MSLEVSRTKNNQNFRSFSQKTRGNMIILHLSLICVLSLRITFILRRREYKCTIPSQTAPPSQPHDVTRPHRILPHPHATSRCRTPARLMRTPTPPVSNGADDVVTGVTARPPGNSPVPPCGPPSPFAFLIPFDGDMTPSGSENRAGRRDPVAVAPCRPRLRRRSQDIALGSPHVPVIRKKKLIDYKLDLT